MYSQAIFNPGEEVVFQIKVIPVLKNGIGEIFDFVINRDPKITEVFGLSKTDIKNIRPGSWQSSS